jgi:hypothetical protein
MCFFNKKKSFLYYSKQLKNSINDIDQDIVFKKNLAHNCKIGMKNIKIMKII